MSLTNLPSLHASLRPPFCSHSCAVLPSLTHRLALSTWLYRHTVHVLHLLIDDLSALSPPALIAMSIFFFSVCPVCLFLLFFYFVFSLSAPRAERSWQRCRRRMPRRMSRSRSRRRSGRRRRSRREGEIPHPMSGLGNEGVMFLCSPRQAGLGEDLRLVVELLDFCACVYLCVTSAALFHGTAAASDLRLLTSQQRTRSQLKQSNRRCKENFGSERKDEKEAERSRRFSLHTEQPAALASHYN